MANRSKGDVERRRSRNAAMRQRPYHVLLRPLQWEGDTATLTRELNEAREHQAAPRNFSSYHQCSHGDLQQVFATMLENAVRICDAKFGNIYRWDGDALHLMASHNIRCHAFSKPSGSANSYRSYDRDQNLRSCPRSGSRAWLRCTRSVDR